MYCSEGRSNIPYLVSMNFCLIFLIGNLGHCLIRVIIKHKTMLRYHFLNIYLTVCEFICC